jgi:integrase
MNSRAMLIKEDYNTDMRHQLQRLLPSLGTDINFSDDIWICDKLKRSPSQLTCHLTLHFSNIPERFKEIVKYFALKRFEDGISFACINSGIRNINTFFIFFTEKYAGLELKLIDRGIIFEYKNYVEHYQWQQSTKEYKWGTLNVFFDTLKGWNELPTKSPTTKANPFSRDESKKYDYKYIPEFVLKQLDDIFRHKELPLYQKTIYWIMRSFPSRVSEVVGAQLDCLKPFNGNWVLFLPSWKQNGGYIVPELRTLYMKYEGHCKYLIDLIRKQQKASNALQYRLEQEKRGMLFTYKEARINVSGYKKAGIVAYDNPNVLHIANREIAARILTNICTYFKVKDENGLPYLVTSHQLRHNGITDRLYEGFSPVEIRYMTAQKSDAMILEAYNHMNLMPDKIAAKQSLVHVESSKAEASTPVYFKGRILNLDEQLEKRLLKNLRTHRLKHGICSDVMNCQNDKRYECLSCRYFIPDANDLKYFENEVLQWERKAEIYKTHPFKLENAIYNLKLNRDIVKRIKNMADTEVKSI